VSRSKLFEYHQRVDEPLCPTLLSRLDEHAVQIGGKLGLVPDPARPFLYYRFRDDQDLKSSGACGLDVPGCAPGDAVFSSEAFDVHELAHAYVDRAWRGQSIGLVDEGEAVALSCHPRYVVQPDVRPSDLLGSPDWRDLLNLHGNTIEGYAAAGVWMTHLARTYGWQRVRALHGRVQPGISAADFEREFARVFPIGMNEAWTAALDTPGASPCEDDWSCTATPLDVGGTAAPDCDGEMHRTITVDAPPGVVLGLEGMNSGLLLRDCSTPSPSPTYELQAGWTARTTHAATVPPATYTLLSAPAPTAVSFVSHLPPGFGAPACSSEGGIALDPSNVTYVDLLAGKADGWISLAGGGHRYSVETLDLFWNGFPAPAGAPVICDRCDLAPTCVALAGATATSLAIGDGAALHLQNLSVFAAPTLYGQVIIYPDAVADGGAP
jgi:hypothetical protein